MPSLMISPFQLASMAQPTSPSQQAHVPFTPYSQNQEGQVGLTTEEHSMNGGQHEQSNQVSGNQKVRDNRTFKKGRGSNYDLLEELKDNS